MKNSCWCLTLIMCIANLYFRNLYVVTDRIAYYAVELVIYTVLSKGYCSRLRCCALTFNHSLMSFSHIEYLLQDIPEQILWIYYIRCCYRILSSPRKFYVRSSRSSYPSIIRFDESATKHDTGRIKSLLFSLITNCIVVYWAVRELDIDDEVLVWSSQTCVQYHTPN